MEKDLRIKKLEKELENKEIAIKVFLEKMDASNELLDKYEDLLAPILEIPKELLEVVGDSLVKDNMIKNSDEAIVTYSLGRLLQDLSKFKIN